MRGIYRKLEVGDEVLRPQYNESVRRVKWLTRKVKNNRVEGIASQAKTHPKAFFQV